RGTERIAGNSTSHGVVFRLPLVRCDRVGPCSRCGCCKGARIGRSVGATAPTATAATGRNGERMANRLRSTSGIRVYQNADSARVTRKHLGRKTRLDQYTGRGQDSKVVT